jgi:hypothetical protein
MRLLLEQTIHATELRVEAAHAEYLRRRPATLASKHAVAEPHPRAGAASVHPVLVRERSLVELRTQPPRGEVPVHQRNEVRPMIRWYSMQRCGRRASSKLSTDPKMTKGEADQPAPRPRPARRATHTQPGSVLVSTSRRHAVYPFSHVRLPDLMRSGWESV